jgi:anti-sigma regulatory factor (Ser/Thr protein kinase)
MANVVVHAYHDRRTGTILLSADLGGTALVVAVSDDGTGMRREDDSPGAGMGLGLIANVSDSLEVHSGLAGTRLVMRFERTG